MSALPTDDPEVQAIRAEANGTDFPVDALPPVCSAMVRATAEAVGVDPAFAAVPMLGVLAGAVGATRVLQLKRNYPVPCSLWCALSARSGSGKTPAETAVAAPLQARDKVLYERTTLAFDRYKADLASRAEGAPEPTPPPRLSSVVGDVTLEGLVSRLVDNPRGLVVAPGEAASWLGSFDKYRAGADGAMWCDIYSARSIRVDRKHGSTPSIRVDRPTVSVVANVQPAVLRRLLTQAHRQSGLAARLHVAQPPSPATHWTDAEPDAATVREYHRVVNGLLDLELAEGQPLALRLDSDARSDWTDFYNAVADQLDALPDDARAAIVKIRDSAPRIALALALANAAEDGTAVLLRTVGKRWMRAGIDVSLYFAAEAKKLYSAIAVDDELDGRRQRDVAAEILTALRATGELDRTAIRDLFHGNVASPAIDAALGQLRAAKLADYRREAAGAKGGRPREVWFPVQTEAAP